MDIPERFGNAIQTYTDKRFYPLDPRVIDVCIKDIAHALSNKCRFSGHTRFFYPVSTHSVMVSYLCDPKDALWGLLHDASEAYLIDLPKPLKILPEFQWFVKLEHKIQNVICQHFELSLEQPESTHVADRIALVTEKRDLMPEAWDWQIKYTEKPVSEKIKYMSSKKSERVFLKRYEELTGIKVLKRRFWFLW